MKILFKILLAIFILSCFLMLLRWAGAPLMNPPQGFNADEPAYIKKQIDFYFVDPEVLAKTEGGEGFGLYCAVWEFKIRGIVSAIIMISTILVISFIENKSKRRLTKLSDGGSVK